MKKPANPCNRIYIYIYIDIRYTIEETKEICCEIRACLFAVCKLYIKYKNIKDKMLKKAKLECKPQKWLVHLARDYLAVCLYFVSPYFVSDSIIQTECLDTS